ncbi:MAG: hypothetical protein HXK95_000185 [Candidatus Nanogingivalaceae bacterium]|nr:MAG: hypothetical protein HXK94_000185 [Candidatus Nanogingivalaceae bacterium]QWB91629.1 MAG: hypothetical protein HXK95_000185 [Candidatus Nanogingivalaceae bacterium]
MKQANISKVRNWLLIDFSVSKIEFKKLSSAFEAESFEKIYSQAGFKRGDSIWLKLNFTQSLLKKITAG